MKKRIVIFASGNGTNAQNIIEHFQQSKNAKVVHVLSNKKNAKVLERAKTLNIRHSYFSKDELNSEKGVIRTLINEKTDLIILAGFLLLFPKKILSQFPNKVINIHPALLPKYGGKGMYGKFVHEAVIANKENETGITIHYVNEKYDEGAIIFQKEVLLNNNDTADTVAKKVQKLEKLYFPAIIEKVITENLNG